MRVNTATSYRIYKKEVENPRPVSVYTEIVYGFFKYMVSLILDGHEIKLPQNCGTMYVKGKVIKPKLDAFGNITGASPDWVKTKQLRESNPQAAADRKIVYHLNDHTNGIRYAIKWTKKNIIAENKSFYSFRAVRAVKRTLSDLIKNNKEYIVE